MTLMLRLTAAVAFFTPLGVVLTEGWPEGVDTTLGRIIFFAFVQACMLMIAVILVAASTQSTSGTPSDLTGGKTRRRPADSA